MPAYRAVPGYEAVQADDPPPWMAGREPEPALHTVPPNWQHATPETADPSRARDAIDPAAHAPPIRGRAEVRALYAELMHPLTPASTAPNGGDGHGPGSGPVPLSEAPTNGSGFLLGLDAPSAPNPPELGERPPEFNSPWSSGLPPGYEPISYQRPPTYQEPRQDDPPAPYEESRYELLRYEDPPRYPEPRYDVPVVHRPPYQPMPYPPAPYEPPPQEQSRPEPPWHEPLVEPEPPPYEPPALPQRTPQPPDVPPVPEGVEPERSGDGPLPGDLNRIVGRLRTDEEDDTGVPGERPDGFDIPAVLAAVRGFPGVREANLRANPDGVHTLRLELADDADPAKVSRDIARLLKERMGLAAEPNEVDTKAGPPAGDPPEDPLTGPIESSAIAPVSAGPLSAGPLSAGPLSAGPLSAGPLSAGPLSAGQLSAGPLPPGVLSHARDPRRRHPMASTGRAEPARVPEFGRGSLYGYPTTEAAPAPPPPRPLPTPHSVPRVILNQVEVSTQGLDAVVEVRLTADGEPAYGVASGPAVDGYVLRLAAQAAAAAIDELLVEPDGATRGRCFIEHAAVIPFGSCEVGVVVLLLVCGGWVEQLAGSALVSGDPRQAVVRATLAAVNRRLEGLLP
jgi:hypothetical protein